MLVQRLQLNHLFILAATSSIPYLKVWDDYVRKKEKENPKHKAQGLWFTKKGLPSWCIVGEQRTLRKYH